MSNDEPTWIRCCRVCGRLDLAHRFIDRQIAPRAPVWDEPWQCQECGATDYEFVEDRGDLGT